MRSRTVALGCLLAGGLLALVATAQPWWRATNPQARVMFTGTETTGGLSQALGLVALAGTLLVLVLKVGGRRVLAVLLGLTGLAAALLGGLQQQPSADAVRARMRQVSLADSYVVSATLWGWVFAAAGALVIVGAATLFVRAAQWPRKADRFQRSQLPPGLSAEQSEASVWNALDAGLDPTIDPADATPAQGHDTEVPGPDVHLRRTRDTMGTSDTNTNTLMT